MHRPHDVDAAIIFEHAELSPDAGVEVEQEIGAGSSVVSPVRVEDAAVADAPAQVAG